MKTNRILRGLSLALLAASVLLLLYGLYALHMDLGAVTPEDVAFTLVPVAISSALVFRQR